MKIQELFEAKYAPPSTEIRNRVTVILDLEFVPKRYKGFLGPYKNAMRGLIKDIDEAGKQLGMKMPKIGFSGSAGFPEGRIYHNSNALRDLIRKVVDATPGFSLKY